jgi:hypothetical protein
VTTAIAKTIQIYLPTGEPRGIRIADITTRLVLAVLIPRSELASGKLRWELDHPGPHPILGMVLHAANQRGWSLQVGQWAVATMSIVLRKKQNRQMSEQQSPKASHLRE